MPSKTRCADMSHSLKMVVLWQHCCPRHSAVEGWIPPVNIYLPCECASVCGAARRQELLWGFICGMTRQPVIYEHLELFFKHSLISRQTFPKAQAAHEWPGPDQTRQDLTPSPPIPRNPWTECRARTSWEQSIKVHVRMFTGCVLWVQPRQLTTTMWHSSDGNHLLRVFLPLC